MSLQWYPGHMAKAVREMKEVLPNIDLIVEVLDARIPYSSLNPVIAGLDPQKPRIKVLTKSDLADDRITDLWVAHFQSLTQTKAIAISTNEADKVRQLIPLIKSLLKNKLEADKKVRVLVAGIPNVGKSTFINTLIERAVAKTGNEPAITKGQQKIKLEEQIMLIDTPGVFWPKIENKNSAFRQGVTGAIKEAIIDNQEVAFYAAEFLFASYPESLINRYELEKLPDYPLHFFEDIGKKRGSLSAGGRVDLDKICTLFINELRDGTLGKISLETPEMIQQELVEVEKQIAAREEKKAERKMKKRKK